LQLLTAKIPIKLTRTEARLIKFSEFTKTMELRTNNLCLVSLLSFADNLTVVDYTLGCERKFSSVLFGFKRTGYYNLDRYCKK